MKSDCRISLETEQAAGQITVRAGKKQCLLSALILSVRCTNAHRVNRYFFLLYL